MDYPLIFFKCLLGLWSRLIALWAAGKINSSRTSENFPRVVSVRSCVWTSLWNVFEETRIGPQGSGVILPPDICQGSISWQGSIAHEHIVACWWTVACKLIQPLALSFVWLPALPYRLSAGSASAMHRFRDAVFVICRNDLSRHR